MADSKQSLPVMDGIEIATPCCVPWEEIQGNGRVRSCQVCRKDVFDLIELTTEEASQLLAQGDGLPCIRICRGPDGRIMTADNPAGLGMSIWRRLRRHSRYAASLFAPSFLPGCGLFNSFYNSFFQYGAPARSIKSFDPEKTISEVASGPADDVAKKTIADTK